ncbi:MAG: DEAD/DEAH box helicase [Bdellovibrionales bacterium]|nr:DEAD/DEAH box helicase [Bdellovibrionales bacterium]
MLPIHIAESVKSQVLHYIGATWEFRSTEADDALTRFITDSDKGLFKGPWIQLQRPFLQAALGVEPPFDLTVPFHPFTHQQKSWLRLTTKAGNVPQPTIVTTGTGSGKTECFLYPVLDTCLRAKRQGDDGIKAIVLYPMNALASDQERRFAEAIWDDPVLKQAGLRVGLFVGRDEGKGASDRGFSEMGKDHGVTDQDSLRENPPDILLTNYKMLDFLLMRPRDRGLWQKNEAGTLKYLILDELHTYDGAQGADVACLIRRLKERLGIRKGEVCVVGTSATIDEGPVSDHVLGVGVADQSETAAQILCRFAGTLFEEEIPDDAIVGEERVAVESLVSFEIAAEEELHFPNADGCQPKDGEDALEYAARQAALWNGPALSGDHKGYRSDLAPGVVEKVLAKEGESALRELCWELALAKWLKSHPLFAAVLKTSEQAERENVPLSFAELVKRTIRSSVSFSAELRDTNATDREAIFASFFSLIAHAKELRSRRPFPLVSIRVQLWMRELRRLGREVSVPVRFQWLEETVPGTYALPAFQCSLCGESGWAGVKKPDNETYIQSKSIDGFQLSSDYTQIYRASLGYRGKKDKRLVYLSRFEAGDDPPEITGKQSEFTDTESFYIHPESLVVRRGRGLCPLTQSSDLVRVKVNQQVKNDKGTVTGDQRCPHCGEADGIFFVGAQAAVLSSVAIDEMYGSPLNSDPKLLAFTDSVQDASHRAGFFSARTYHFTFRTALQHMLDEAGEAGVPLSRIGEALLQYWSEASRKGGGSVRDAIELLLPPDLREYESYLAFRDSDASVPAQKFRHEVERRLYWEAVSEFGLMLTHGRTMERMGSAALGWDDGIISRTVDEILDRAAGIDEVIQQRGSDSIRIWLLGLLYRYRRIGVLSHPFLAGYAPSAWWGKSGRGKDNASYTPAERETFPPGGRYKPAMLVTSEKRGSAFQYLLADSQGKSVSPWTILWARRALNYQGNESAIIDLHSAFLKAGEESGLLQRLHKESERSYYTISSEAAYLVTEPQQLVCSRSGKYIVRPKEEAALWQGAPSLEYRAEEGRYELGEFNARQDYYRARYRKGALRRVVAQEHTGLLRSDRRRELEQSFTSAKHRDDPNVLTCTSTLEMGIDIGDLSSTMLCSIPPSTANYLQRIGRAGRSTGSSFIISVVNQRPHDLFFFARPQELLKGKIDTPGCWLDASAVLLRQYFGYCFDQAVRRAALDDFPRGAVTLVEDERKPTGIFRQFINWIEEHEEELQTDFLTRFSREIRDNTRARFLEESRTVHIAERVHSVLENFASELTAIEKAQGELVKRLQGEGLTTDDRRDIEQEQKILRGRKGTYSRISSYQLLCDHGLLPNYAFPDRGVRFHGSIYNRHQGRPDEPIEMTRSAGTALRELAPLNYFYTHGRTFEIQRLTLGNPEESLIEEFGVCSHCSYMLRIRPDKRETQCPQCLRSGNRSPGDQGNRHKFVEFPRSYALSQMEFYESLSADRAEERERKYYRLTTSFDTTLPSDFGVVGEDSLPFAAEYRAQICLREINTGHFDSQTAEVFGGGQEASTEAFQLCRDCGAVVEPGQPLSDVKHTRSCAGKKRAETAEKKGKGKDNAYSFEAVYLYRELKSEGLRLLVPYTDGRDLSTLSACLELGLKRMFRGSPNHLIVRRHTLPTTDEGVVQSFLVLLDGVPGGTGYLKSLFEKKDLKGRAGQGIVEVLELALQALETCSCRVLPGEERQEDTDGCYRCLRSYQSQFRSDEISRNHGVKLLTELIRAARGWENKTDLTEISTNALFESALEQRFILELTRAAEERNGEVSRVIVRGRRGFRLNLPEAGQVWDIEQQVLLNDKDGVAVPSKADFVLWPEHSDALPIAVFADGKDFHADVSNNRLADDFQKRRSIIASGNFLVWNVTWRDLSEWQDNKPFAFTDKLIPKLQAEIGDTYPGASRSSIQEANKNCFRQLVAFLHYPNAKLWQLIGEKVAVKWLSAEQLSGAECYASSENLPEFVSSWGKGGSLSQATSDRLDAGREYVLCNRIALDQNYLAFAEDSALGAEKNINLRVFARLKDDDNTLRGEGFLQEWRQFLAGINLYQFAPNFKFWATSEIKTGTGPELASLFALTPEVLSDWESVLDEVVPSLRSTLELLSRRSEKLPEVAVYEPEIATEAEAELVWRKGAQGVAVLCGEQLDLKERWALAGWEVFSADEFKLAVRESIEGVLAKISI